MYLKQELVIFFLQRRALLFEMELKVAVSEGGSRLRMWGWSPGFVDERHPGRGSPAPWRQLTLFPGWNFW